MAEQINLFAFMQQEPTAFNPVYQYVRHGSGFSGGIERIKDFFAEHPEKRERVDFLKQEYGNGGWSLCDKRPCHVYSGDHNSAKHTIWYLDENMEPQKRTLTYAQLETAIQKLISMGKYEFDYRGKEF